MSGPFKAVIRRRARLILAIWSSTRAFVGYRTTVRRAASLEDGRAGSHLSGLCDHHSLTGSGRPQFRASIISRARTGSRNASVLPEPVPDVTTGFTSLGPVESAARNDSAWCSRTFISRASATLNTVSYTHLTLRPN